jgi:hypothetical protein
MINLSIFPCCLFASNREQLRKEAKPEIEHQKKRKKIEKKEVRKNDHATQKTQNQVT